MVTLEFADDGLREIHVESQITKENLVEFRRLLVIERFLLRRAHRHDCFDFHALGEPTPNRSTLVFQVTYR